MASTNESSAEGTTPEFVVIFQKVCDVSQSHFKPSSDSLLGSHQYKWRLKDKLEIVRHIKEQEI